MQFTWAAHGTSPVRTRGRNRAANIRTFLFERTRNGGKIPEAPLRNTRLLNASLISHPPAHTQSKSLKTNRKKISAKTLIPSDDAKPELRTAEQRTYDMPGMTPTNQGLIQETAIPAMCRLSNPIKVRIYYL